MFGCDVEAADRWKITKLTFEQRPVVVQDKGLAFHPVAYGPQKSGANGVALSTDDIVDGFAVVRDDGLEGWGRKRQFRVGPQRFGFGSPPSGMCHGGPLLGASDLVVALGTFRSADKIFARGIGPGRPPARTMESLRGQLGLPVIVSVLRECRIRPGTNDEENHEGKQSGWTFRRRSAFHHRRSLPRASLPQSSTGTTHIILRLLLGGNDIDIFHAGRRVRSLRSKEPGLELLVPAPSFLHLVIELCFVSYVVEERIPLEIGITEEATLDGMLKHVKGGRFVS